MRKLFFIFTALFLSISFLVAGEPVLLKSFKVGKKIGFKKFGIPAKKRAMYDKLIIETSDNEIRVGGIRLYFVTGAEERHKFKEEELISTPDEPLVIVIEKDMDLKKIRIYLRNMRDMAKKTRVKIYGVVE